MVGAELRRAWRFFVEHAGYATPPGRAACALSLARAERAARSEGLVFEWQDDHDGWQEAPADGEDIAPRESCEVCLCRAESGEVLACLGGIWDADAACRRVVEAEMAAEAVAVLVEREVLAVQSL